MKEPEHKLPWSFNKDNTVGIYYDNPKEVSPECFLITDADWKEGDIDYIEQACNNFPKAVELLKKALLVLEDMNSEPEDEVRSFLKEINV